MAGRKKYLLKNTALFALNNIATKLITFFLVPIYTAVLTTDEYGTADLITTLSAILIPVFTLNVCEAVMRFALDKNADIRKIINIGITFGGISILVGVACIPLFSLYDAFRPYRIIIAIYCVMQGLQQIFTCNLRGQEKLREYAASNITYSALAGIFNIIFLVLFRWGLTGYFTAFILADIVSSYYAIIKGNVIDAIRNYSFDKSLAASMIKYSIFLVPTSMMWWIMNSSDRVMVTAMIGASANGIYAISYKFPSVLSVVSSVVNQAWSYSAIKENESSDREAFNNKMYRLLVSVLTLTTGLLILLIKPILKFYVSSEYYSAWRYTPYLFIGFLFMSLGTFLSTSYTVNKDSKGFLLSGMAGAILNVILNWILIPKLGVAGAALATCLSYFMVFLYRAIDTRKYLIIHVGKPVYVISLVINVIMAITIFLNNNWSYVLMIIELLALIVIQKNFVKKSVKTALNMITKKVSKKI